MRQVICFAVIVIVSFLGMVAMRENGRRSDGPQVATIRGTSPSNRNATISTGEAVKIEDHLANDKWTVVQFTADW